MYRIDVINLLNEKESHYWLNKKNDDFIQFLPKQFGVPKENIEVFHLGDENKPLLEAYLRSHKKNELDFSEQGKIKVKRVAKKMLEVGDEIEKEVYAKMKADRLDDYKALKTASSKIKDSKVSLKDGKEIVIIEIDDDLAQDIEEVVVEFSGKKLKSWPYTESGKFKGNEFE